MVKRSITGLFIAAVFVGVVVCALKVHYLFFDVFVAALMLISAFEVARALKNKFACPFLTVIYMAIVLGFVAFYTLVVLLPDEPILASLAFFAVLALFVVASMVYNAVSKQKRAGSAVATQLTLLYPCVLMVCMLSVNYLALPYRAIALIMLFTVTPLTDVLAYLVGSTLKGKKLCPSISPKKTISGAVGGLVGGLIGGAIMILLTTNSAFDWLGIGGMIGGNSTINAINCLLLGLLGSICTQGGDLIASLLKRKCLVKDYGKILPGHGGIMDRIDGMIVNAALLFIYMSGISLIW